MCQTNYEAEIITTHTFFWVSSEKLNESAIGIYLSSSDTTAMRTHFSIHLHVTGD